MQVRFIRLVVLVVAVCVVAAGCGKYSIGNIRSAKAFQDANGLYKKADYKGAVERYEDSIRFNPELGFAYFFLGNSYDQMYRPAKKGDQRERQLPPARRAALPDGDRQAGDHAKIRRSRRFGGIRSST